MFADGQLYLHKLCCVREAVYGPHLSSDSEKLGRALPLRAT
jgi:hypothetical protein